MSRVVHLHIGAPKTGTTYLQERLARNAAKLAEHEVHFPGRSRLGNPATFQFRAALDLRGQDWGGPPGHAEGAWPALVRRVRRRSGTVVVSHEILAPASGEQIARAMNDLAGSEIHVVYTARDLARQLPAAWQESIKQGRRWSFNKFLDKAGNGETFFMRAFDLPSVLSRWAVDIPPERVHVVTVPPSGAPREELWNRFCLTVGIDPAWAPLETRLVNESLGVVEIEVLRQLNRRTGRSTRREQDVDPLIRGLVRRGELVPRSSRKVVLPADRYPWAEDVTATWMEWLEKSGVDVVGDIEDLRLPPVEETGRRPNRVSKGDLVEAALDALGVMTRVAASRPDPQHELGARIRKTARRVRQR